MKQSDEPGGLSSKALHRSVFCVATALAISAASVTVPAHGGEPIRFVRPNAGEKPPLRVNFAAEKAGATETPTASSISRSSQAGGTPGYSVRRPRARKGWPDSPEAPSETPASIQTRPSSSASINPRVENPSGSVFGPGPSSNPNEQRSALRSISQGTLGDRASGTLDGPALGMSGSARPGSGSGQPTIPPGRNGLDPAASAGLAPGPGSGSSLGGRAPAGPPRANSPYDPANRPLNSSFDPPPRPR